MSLNVDIKILCDQSLNKLFSDKNWENQKNRKDLPNYKFYQGTC